MGAAGWRRANRLAKLVGTMRLLGRIVSIRRTTRRRFSRATGPTRCAGSWTTRPTAARRRSAGPTAHFALVRAGIASRALRTQLAQGFPLLGAQDLHQAALDFLLQSVELLLLIVTEIEAIPNMGRQQLTRFEGAATAAVRWRRSIRRAIRPTTRRPAKSTRSPWAALVRRLAGSGQCPCDARR